MYNKYSELNEVNSTNTTIVGANNSPPIMPESPSDLSKNIQEAISYDNSNSLMPKDVRSLKANRYDKIADSFKESFVIKNKKTGQIVELKAINAFHAANLIGWRPNHVVLMDTISHEEKKEDNPLPENNQNASEKNDTDRTTQEKLA